MNKRILWSVVAGSLVATQLFAASLTVEMYKTGEKKPGPSIGKIYFDDTEHGLLIKPQLSDLPPGKHGFHIHQKPSCANAGKAAGGHFDPADTHKHLGPKNKHGHLGDLPVLVVAKDGETHEPMLAPRLKVSDIVNHAVMIHAGGDNYSDEPKPLGGGGARIACGVAR